MAENISSPVFANRYRFQPVPNDWDRGRSGYTHLVFDTKKEHLGVIKRAELNSQKAVDALKNEVATLLDLKAKGVGVPEVYDTGEAEYGSKKYYFTVMEYIEGLRVERNLGNLTAVERADILTQLFRILAEAHKMGITNGDVDLKHLFWRKEKKQLIVIDWGNARLDVDPRKKDEFAYDLARSAEIIYSLVTRKGRPSTTGSLALPKDAALISGLPPLPVAFHNLCKWAPRTPGTGIQPPYTAQELAEVSMGWQKGVPYKPAKRVGWVWGLFFAAIIPLMAYLVLAPQSPLHGLIYGTAPVATASNASIPTMTKELIPTQTKPPTITPTGTMIAIDTPTLSPTAMVSPTNTIHLPTTPIARTYTKTILLFDNTLSEGQCTIKNDLNLQNGLQPSEGLTKRPDKNWQFKVEDGRTPDEYLMSDFSSCLDVSQVHAIALNASILRLELQRKLSDSGTIEDGKQFGIFIENENGRRREYTIWVDLDKKMHLRVREGTDILFDDSILVVNEKNIKIQGAYPRLYAVFPIQIFLELNNEGMDVPYLKEGVMNRGVKSTELDPSNQMIIVDKAVFPSLGPITRIGLIDYGGETQALIWPVVFWGESTE